jgi:hypothetical protein
MPWISNDYSGISKVFDVEVIQVPLPNGTTEHVRVTLHPDVAIISRDDYKKILPLLLQRKLVEET